MIETFVLRDYQQETVDKVYAEYGQGVQRTAAVLPTGAGKTVVGLKPVADCIAAGRRALWLAHRTELIEQAEEKLKGDSSGLDVGVLQARRREVDRAVIVASIMTAIQPGALSLLRQLDIGLVVYDEVHHATAPSSLRLLDELGLFDPAGPRLLGLTATLARGDGISLGQVIQTVAHAVPFQELVRKGYLLRPRGIRVKVEGLDFSTVRQSRSESGIDDHAAAQAMSDSLAPAAIARAYLEHARGRKGVCFLPTVELSKEQAEVFRAHGVNAIHVDADTPKAVRAEILKRVKRGEYDMVCNVGLFTEGTDVPIWSVVILGRPTSSETLFTQMLGRPARPYPGQTDFLVLDVVGVTGRHRLRPLCSLEGALLPEEIPEDLLDLLDDAPVDDDDEPRTTDAMPPAESTGDDGTLHVAMIDLFSASDTEWLRSPRGVWFLPTDDESAVLLAPGLEPETYDVLLTDGTLVHEACALDTAMSWGEKHAKSVAKQSLDRDAPWRGKKLSRAERLNAVWQGVRPDGGAMTRGALAGAAAVRWAAVNIDTLPQVEQVGPAGYWTNLIAT